jgi:hypothetical protein
MMKLATIILMFIALLFGAMTGELALARGHGGGSHGGGHHSGGHHSGGGHHGHGSRWHPGAFAGGGVFGLGYYYSPSYYYAWPVEIPYSPPGYIEQGTDLYYCTSAQSYYPDVKECPEGWQAITPEPTPPSPLGG